MIHGNSNDTVTHDIDLCAPEGNAFALLGLAKNYANQLGLNWDTVGDEMRSSDYSHLVKTMNKYFPFINFYNGKRAGI
jgi:hypothetical protein